MNAMAPSPYWPHLLIPGERLLRPAACRERPDGASRATGLLCSAGAALRYRDAAAGTGGGFSPTWVADRQPSSGSGTAFASMLLRRAHSRCCSGLTLRHVSL